MIPDIKSRKHKINRQLIKEICQGLKEQSRSPGERIVYEVTDEDLENIKEEVAKVAIRETLKCVIDRLLKSGIPEGEAVSMIMGADRMDNIVNIYNQVKHKN